MVNTDWLNAQAAYLFRQAAEDRRKSNCRLAEVVSLIGFALMAPGQLAGFSIVVLGLMVSWLVAGEYSCPIPARRFCTEQLGADRGGGLLALRRRGVDLPVRLAERMRDARQADGGCLSLPGAHC